MSHPVIVVGSGGHAKVLIDALLIQNFRVLGITDKDLSKEDNKVLGVPVIGGDDVIFQYHPSKILLVNGIGSATGTSLRKELFDKFKNMGFSFLNLIHPSAIFANDVELAEGTQIMAGAVIQTGSFVGKNSIINTKVSIDHDCLIGNHVHIAPGVTLSGGVTVKDCTHIGTGATVIQGIHIGRNCLIGAGSLVNKDVPDGSKVFGVPAKVVIR